MEFSADALGQIIEKHRTAGELTQQLLGELAGYGAAGAAVSISRVENGHVLPRLERRRAIAEVFGLTLEELEAEATERTREIAAGLVPVGRAAASTVQAADLAKRTELLTRKRDQVLAGYQQARDAYIDACDRSVDEYFMPLVDISTDIDGAVELANRPTSIAPAIEVEPPESRFRRARCAIGTVSLSGTELTAIGGSEAAGKFAAYAMFQATMRLGTAGTGRRITDLSGAAKQRAALARFGGGTEANGGGGMAGGLGRLEMIASTVELLLPLTIDALNAALRMKKEAQFRKRLDELETELKATRTSYQALADHLPRATVVLNHIAVHGTHALDRWVAGLGPLPWGPLTPEDEERYRVFVELAACQVVLAAIDVQGVLELRDDELAELIATIDEDVTRAEEISKLV